MRGSRRGSSCFTVRERARKYVTEAGKNNVAEATRRRRRILQSRILFYFFNGLAIITILLSR